MHSQPKITTTMKTIKLKYTRKIPLKSNYLHHNWNVFRFYEEEEKKTLNEPRSSLNNSSIVSICEYFADSLRFLPFSHSLRLYFCLVRRFDLLPFFQLIAIAHINPLVPTTFQPWKSITQQNDRIELEQIFGFKSFKFLT